MELGRDHVYFWKKNRSMKTIPNHPALKIRFLQLVLILLIGWLPFHSVLSQERKVFNHDYLLPPRGKSMVEMYSGIPYVAIGQYAYGFSDKVSVGIVYGYTPFVKGYGLRVKAIVAQPSESFRLYAKSPFLYYPKTKNGEGDPWVLAWPTLNAEWKFKNGGRCWAGAGVIGAGCYDYIFRREAEMKEHQDGDKPSGGEEELMAGIWNTFQFGYSKPISNKFSFVVEVAPVMEGFKLKSKQGFLDTAPLIGTVGLTYSF